MKSGFCFFLSVFIRVHRRLIIVSIRRQRRIRHFARLLHQLHIQTQRLQLADQHVERFGDARLDGGFTFDNRLVNLGAAIHVVGLGRKQFLQNIGGAVGFEGPDFHFAETLSAELGLAAQGLLCDQRVRADGTGVDLVVHQVRELHHIDVAHGDGLLELRAGHAVVQSGLAGAGQLGVAQSLLDFALGGAVEDGGGELHTQGLGGPAEVGFENLAHVHTGRHAEGVEHDFDGGAVGQIGHVFVGENAGDDALVAVAAGHLVADRKLALHGDIDFDQLDDAGREFVALAELGDLLVGDFFEDRDLARGHLLDFVDLFVETRVFVGQAHAFEIAGFHLLDDFAIELGVFGEQALVGLFVVQVGQQLLAVPQAGEALGALVGEDADFILQVALEALDLRFLDGFRALVLFLALAREDLAIDDGAFDSGRAVERSILDVAGFFAEDGAQQLLFGGELGFALGGYFAHQDVAGLDGGADADDAAFIQVAEEGIGDVGDIAGDFFGTELGVAGFDFELFNVDRSVVVFFDQLFADQDGVFKVVAAPGHEGHQNVASEGQFAEIGAGAICQDSGLLDALPHANDGFLIDAGVLVGALELGELVDIGAHLAGELAFVGRAFHANDNALGIDRIDDAGAFAENHGAGIASGDVLHAGAHVRGVGAQQGHCLALHVGTHQGAVGLIVLKERDEAGGDRDELLGADVDVFDFVAGFQNEVAGLAGVGKIGDDAAFFVELDVGLGNRPLVLFPRREVLAVGFEFGGLLLGAELAVGFLGLATAHDVADFIIRVAGIEDTNLVNDHALLDFAIGTFDEAVFVDAGETGERRNQADVRAFRRLDGADAAVVRGVHVANFESGALAAETTGSQRREAALVGDFGKRVGLVHELRELAGAEELADGRHHRLGVHQVVGHGGRHFLVDRHFFLDGALHAHEADTELVFQQLADRADAAVAEVIDIVDVVIGAWDGGELAKL